MELPPILLQFIGSLVAILVLAGLARGLKLGQPPRMDSEKTAISAAEEAVSGFEPTSLSLDELGRGALLRNAEGQILVLRQHGSHFAGRVLTPSAEMSLDGEELIIDTAERRFGQARLIVHSPQAWVQALEEIKRSHNA